jgi:hypothetical protein
LWWRSASLRQSLDYESSEIRISPRHYVGQQEQEDRNLKSISKNNLPLFITLKLNTTQKKK